VFAATPFLFKFVLLTHKGDRPVCRRDGIILAIMDFSTYPTKVDNVKSEPGFSFLLASYYTRLNSHYVRMSRLDVSTSGSYVRLRQINIYTKIKPSKTPRSIVWAKI